MGIHAGHRERVRQRYLETGLKGFDDVNVLELLLFYAMPRQDTNPIAHALLDRFGSLHGVLEASIQELKTVNGVGENTAILLSLVPEISRRYLFGKKQTRKSLSTTQELFDYVLPLFAFHLEEYLYMVSMDAGNKVLACSEVAQGAVDSVNVNTRKILATALEKRASKIVLAHNHPSGILIPSPADIAITRELQEALKVFEIELMDHIIVGDGECFSMRCGGYF